MAYFFDRSLSQFFSYISPTNLATPLSLSAWINIAAAPDVVGTPIGRANRSQNIGRCVLQINTNRTIRLVYGNTTLTTVTSSTAIATNTWTHIGATVTTTASALFVNGVKTSGAVGLNTAQNALGIGAVLRSSTADFFNGTIAEGAIWSTELSDDEMTSLYKGFKAYRICPNSLFSYVPIIRSNQEITSNQDYAENNGPFTVETHSRVY
jgi:hypothetical protein